MHLDSKTKEFHQFPLDITQEEVSLVTDQVEFAYMGITSHNFYEGCGKEDCEWCNFVKENYTGEIPSEEKTMEETNPNVAEISSKREQQVTLFQ